MGDHNDRIGELESQMQLMKSMMGNGGGGSGDGMLDALETLVNNLRKECHSKFASRDSHDSLEKRLKELEKSHEELQEKEEKLENNVGEMDKTVKDHTIDIGNTHLTFRGIESKNGQDVGVGRGLERENEWLGRVGYPRNP